MWVGGSVAVAALFQVIQLAVLARILTATDLGLIAIVTLMTTFIEILVTMGISNSIVQRNDVSRNELSSLHWLNVIVGFGSGVVLFFCAPLVAWFFNDDRLVYLVQIIACVFVVTPFGQVFRGALEKKMAFKQVAVSEVAGAIAIMVASIGFALAFGVVGVVLGTVVGYLVRTGILVVAGWSTVGLTTHFRPSETKRFLEFGIFQSLDSIVGFIGANAGSVVIGRAISTQQLGGYNLAYNFAVNTPGRLNPIVTRVMFPAMSQIQDDKPRLAENSLKLITVTGIASAPILAGLVVLAPQFTEVVLGEKWLWVVPLLQVLAIVGYVRSVANPMGVILMAINKMKLGLVINTVKTALTIVLVIIGAQRAEAEGVAVALAIMGGVTLVVNYFLMRSILDVTLKPFLAAHLTPVLLAVPMAIAVGVVILALSAVGSAVLTLVVGVVVGAAVFLLGILLSKIPLLIELKGLLPARWRPRNA